MQREEQTPIAGLPQSITQTGESATLGKQLEQEIIVKPKQVIYIGPCSEVASVIYLDCLELFDTMSTK